MTPSRGRRRQTKDTALVDGGTLTREDLIETLEELVRTGGPSSKIQAIRLLKDMADDDTGPSAGGFDDLDGDDEEQDEVTKKRQSKAAKGG